MMVHQSRVIPVSRGSIMQKGYGLGGIFKGFLRTIAPKGNQGIKEISKTALKTGLDTLGDVAKGSILKSSLKRRAEQNLRDMIVVKKPLKLKNSRHKISSKKLAKKKGRERHISQPKDIFSQIIKGCLRYIFVLCKREHL